MKGALKCAIHLSSYFNMPVATPQEIEAANKTLNLAFDCLVAEGIPYHLKGCQLKLDMDREKMIPSLYSVENYYMS